MENISEFDLKKFFPTVSHQAIANSLNKRGVSGLWRDWILVMIKARTKLPVNLECPDYVSGGPSYVFENRFEQLYHPYEPEFVRPAKEEGVSMGFPLSPLLSVLVLHDALLLLKEKVPSLV